MTGQRQKVDMSALSGPLIRVSGHIVDVSAQAFRVAGLSPFVKLGDCVVCNGPEGEELGEIVRVEEAAATVKPFAVRFQSGVRTLAWRTGPVTVAPSPSWRGRTIDAFGRPCDDLGPLGQGPVSYLTDTLPDAAMRRGRVKDKVSTGSRRSTSSPP